MRRVLVCALVAALLVPASSAFAAAAGQAAGTASISGKGLANNTVRLRDVQTGQLTGSTTANASGQFSFTGLNAGNYLIEVVNAAGEVLGTSVPIAVAAGAAVTGIGVSAAAAAAIRGTTGSVFASTLGIVTLGVAAGAVTGVTVAVNRSTASGSQ